MEVSSKFVVSTVALVLLSTRELSSLKPDHDSPSSTLWSMETIRDQVVPNSASMGTISKGSRTYSRRGLAAWTFEWNWSNGAFPSSWQGKSNHSVSKIQTSVEMRRRSRFRTQISNQLILRARSNHWIPVPLRVSVFWRQVQQARCFVLLFNPRQSIYQNECILSGHLTISLPLQWWQVGWGHRNLAVLQNSVHRSRKRWKDPRKILKEQKRVTVATKANTVQELSFHRRRKDWSLWLMRHNQNRNKPWTWVNNEGPHPTKRQPWDRTKTTLEIGLQLLFF